MAPVEPPFDRGGRPVSPDRRGQMPLLLFSGGWPLTVVAQVAASIGEPAFPGATCAMRRSPRWQE